MSISSVLSQRSLCTLKRALAKLFGAAILAASAMLLAAGPARAAVTYNTGLAAPPGTYYGTGNPNTHWVVNNANGAEIGLQTLLRYSGSVAPSPTNSSTYYVPLGPTTVSGKTGSAWGFAFSLNLSGAGLTLSDVSTSLQMQDVANGTTGSFDVLSIPDNYGWGPSGEDANSGDANNSLDASADYGVQNAEALSYSSIAGAFNDSGYNMNQNDTYNFLFSVTCKSGTSCAGQQLASVDSTVIAGSGAPVPEPPTLAIFGVGLLGLLGLGWRHRERDTLTPI